MPQPIKLKSWNPSAGAVLQRPEHAMLIAAIAAEWTQVEDAMINLLGGAYGRTLFNADGPRDVEHHPVARAAMEAAETIRARIKLLDLSLAVLVAGTLVEPIWLDIRDRLQKRARERNRIVHGRWGIEANEPDDLVLRSKDGYSRWTVQDFQDVLARIVALRWEVVGLSDSIMQAVRSGEIAEGVMGPQTGWVPGYDGHAGSD